MKCIPHLYHHHVAQSSVDPIFPDQPRNLFFPFLFVHVRTLQKCHESQITPVALVVIPAGQRAHIVDVLRVAAGLVNESADSQQCG